MIRHLAATAVAALLFGALGPASAANAADATLTGVLSDTSGPQKDLVIGWVEADDFSNSETATSTGDGSYSLEIPGDVGDFYLFTNFTLNADGGGSARLAGYTGEFFGASGERDFLHQGVTPYSAAPSGPLDITLTPAGNITGTLPAYAGGGATLKTLGDTTVGSTSITSEGKFGFSGLVPGQYRVEAWVGLNARNLSPAFTVESGEATEVGTGTDADVLPVAAKISGVVKNGDKVLPNVSVEVYESIFTRFPRDEVDYPVGSDRTDSKGRYSFAGLNPGNYTLVLRNWAKEAGKSFVPELVAVPGLEAIESRSVTSRLGSAGIVTGKVKMTPGATFFRVKLFTSSKRLVGETSGSSSSARFYVTGVPAGKYTAYFTDSKAKYWASQSVTVAAKKSLSVGTRTLSKKTATLAGTVTGATGGYVAVSRGGEQIATTEISSSAHYRLTGLIPGNYGVGNRARGFAPKTRTIAVSPGMSERTLSKGEPLARFTGTALVDGVPVREGFGGYNTSDGAYAFFYADSRGEFAAFGWPGTATFENFGYENRPLPAFSPYWYEAPDNVKTIVLTGGETTMLGTFEFVLHGMGQR